MLDKQKSEFFDEETADQQVIESLLRKINELRGGHAMSRIVETADNGLMVVHQFEELTLKEAEEILERFNQDVQRLEKFIASEKAKLPAEAPADPPVADPAPAAAAPETPPPPAPADPGAPAADPAPATDPNVAAPTDGASTDTPAPEAPADPAPAATDPAGNPITLQ